MQKSIYNIRQYQRGVKKNLFVFDFDETITSKNTDTWIHSALDDGKLPKEVLDKFISKGQWIDFMQIVFDHMHKQGIKVEQMKKVQQQIPLVPGMIDVLKNIKDNDHDAIIISNANNLFIDWILEHHNLQDHVKRIFTNPAYVSENGKIEISGAHTHECNVCWSNQCKTKSMLNYLDEVSNDKQQQIYDKISYFGDGINDLCPILNLDSIDFGFCRVGMGLEEAILKIKQDEKQQNQIKCKIIYWQDGKDVLNAFKQHNL
ncbi:HAD-like domain [Pseudocohnilembus persalinus]|uniref:HAD-like domain n=1 Tax=Pseudocohnilembus persalinus TaxID=266149 RepID=A0A0V0R4A5_PSEPJ|nr:HAD-like domain [Pseudocohnilembus persalinus]|eukprot:KRX09226.1 HAD-like domain [Pseudocohnilembus persalinus]